MKRLLAVALSVAVGWSTLARADLLRLNADPAASNCFIPDPGPGGQVTVYVFLKYTVGSTAVSFSAPVPPYSGLQWVGDVLPPGFAEAGNSQTHADVAFPTCLAGSILVMEIHFIRVGDADPCVQYLMQPGASELDCSFVENSDVDSQRGVVLNANGTCSSTYRHPFPADGAVDVPLKTVLDWVNPISFDFCETPITASAAATPPLGQVYFGTTPNPPYDADATYYHGVGPLLPATKYYWRVNAPYGPLWSFTTMSTVATTPTTWGLIKALYR